MFGFEFEWDSKLEFSKEMVMSVYKKQNFLIRVRVDKHWVLFYMTWVQILNSGYYKIIELVVR